jgi:hypothetical protein
MITSLCALVFCCCDKIPEINLRKERFILAPSFRGFSPWSLAPLLVAKNMMAGECGAHFPTARKQEERKGQDIPMKGTLLLTYFLQPGRFLSSTSQ